MDKRHISKQPQFLQTCQFGAEMTSSWRKYLLWFAQEHVDFRFQEIASLLSTLQIKMRHVEQPTSTQPYWIVEFEKAEHALKLANRSVSLRSCLELWGYARTIEELHVQLKASPAGLMEKYFREDKSFKIEVETFCKHFTQKEKVEKIELFDYLPVKGPVKLKNPDVCFQYIEYYGTDTINPPELPHAVFFGRWICNGLRLLLKKLSLKTRKFIGNTSMDPQLSLLMANQACVKKGDLIIDPFVGTGSLLVAAAEFGAFVFGTDIDYLMLHAKTRPSRITQKERAKDESIRANMKQYNLEHLYGDVMVNDFSIKFWRDDFQFDAIITDPPYGIREATEKIGTTKDDFTVKEEHLLTHYPAKIEYGLSKLYGDLLSFAVCHLKLKGRLVMWFPVFREDYSKETLPYHPCLELIGNSEQVLSKHTSRRLLTYEKFTEPNEEEQKYRHDIKDFRFKYYEQREDSRKERRTREAAEREFNKQKYGKSDNKDNS